MLRRIRTLGIGAFLIGIPLLAAGCESYFFLPGTLDGKTSTGSVITTGDPFSDQLIQRSTFFNGKAVTTITYKASDITRTPFGIDFNGDGKIDPVAGYALDPLPSAGIIQILLSQGDVGTVDFISLTLDGNNTWRNLSDVAVGDIDGDGAPDIVAAVAGGVVYLHNPGPGLTTRMRDWGAETPELELLAGSGETLSSLEINSIIEDIIPPGVTIDQYDVTVEQGYTNVEIADFDADGNNDIVASRRLKVVMMPKPDAAVEPILIITGGMQIFVNPGGAVDGQDWELAQVGRHERYADLDREGANAMLAYDVDGDGDLDIVSAAQDDDNAQITWYENPGPGKFFDLSEWTAWRIGSVRNAFGIDIADVTGDGKVDVIAAGAAQGQVLLFAQPEEGPRREYDWDTYPIINFENFEPHDVRALDIDNDGQLELVVGASGGAVRYFERVGDPTDEWVGVRILDYTSGGDVGYLGYGDLDADGDYDLVTVVDSNEDTGDTVSWIRNDLNP